MLQGSILAKEKRKEYTLNPLPPPNARNAPSVPSDPPHPLAPQAPHPPSATATGPDRADRVSKQARRATGPLTRRRKRQASAETTDAILQITPGDASINPSSACTDKTVTTNVDTSSDATSHNPDASSDESHLSNIPGNESHLSDALDDESRPSDPLDDDLSGVSDTEMDDSELVITVDDNALAVTIPAEPEVETRFLPLLGVHTLVESESPALLSVDGDVRPDWLLTVTKEYLPFVPYLGCLGKVIDLFLAQEARLGYPSVVSVFAFYSAQFTYSHPQVQARGPPMC